MWFTRVSIKNPVLATMVMLAFVVLGLFALQRLKVDQFPDVEFPVVVVQVAYPGASPEIVESEVTKKIEEAVNTIAGINQLTSRSYDGQSVVIVQFNLDMDGRKAAEDVREKVAAVRPLLHDEVEEPRVLRFDPASRAVYTLALTSPDGTQSPVALSSYADQVVKKRLENVRGVGSVTLVGGLEREINIYLRPEAMEALGVGVDQVLQAVRNENQDLPAGALRSSASERVVQVNGRIRRPQDFGQIIVARKGSGGSSVPVRLWQVADVVDGPQEVESLALFNGRRTLALSVQKAQGENTIDVVDGLNRVLDELRRELPPGLALDVVSDNSRPIRVAVKNVRQTLLEGALLTIAIVFLFLNSWRSTVITGLTLPIALIGTFLFMYWFGFSINMLTLMALSLCVGLLIDDAIVVRENIVRHVQMGKDPRRASLDGTQEIGMAVLATTLSIVAVFLPIGFMGGIIGRFFHQFGVTIVAAVLISMFVSFTLDPMLSSVWHDPAIDHRPGARGGRPSRYDRTLGRLTGAVERFSDRLSVAYQRILAWSLRHKRATLGIAALSLLLSFGLVPVLGTEFVPKADFSETSISFYTPSGSSIEVTEAKARQVDAIVREFPEVRYTMATLNAGQAQGRNYATLQVRLVDRDQRSLGVDRMSVLLRERLARVPGITVTHVGLLDSVGGGKPLSVSLQGGDLRELQRLADTLTARLRTIAGLVDLDTTMKPSKPTVEVSLKRDAASDLGLGVGSLTDTLRALVAGQTTGNWRAEDDESYDVKVRLAPNARDAAADLQRLGLSLPATDGGTRIVRLSQVAEVRPSFGPTQINRRDLNREVEITANVSGRSLGEVSADIRQVLEQTALQPGYRWRFGGATKDMQESFGYAVSALALAVIFIYMILASQFKSFLQPIALMSSLPLTLIGVVLILLVFGSTLNMFSIIGIVMLMGLVTKNAILLVDFANRARTGDSGEAGDGRRLDREAALLMAARVRLRPILMTTLAMVFGMVPLAFALSEGAEQRAPMGQAVIGGVVTSSLLTLVVVPVIYCYLDDLSSWLKRKLAAPTGAHQAAAAGEAK
ncbi:efflux RND transporter permease subunit [Eleftheria terrae]|uniref:efflux RND transporter permease subunit n=1 Tax=Eleftheria terrae TaxID=1597781 RepID=UPI00263A621B|nr:efflux RND transporter permease subunit [Eleftheria terrae]WKB52579.1 efflux RND transporter permease subunit [Eleftheria terrae]